MFWLYVVALVPFVYFCRAKIRSFFIPRAIPGIPSWPDPSPFLGDIPRLAKFIKTSGGFTSFTDQCAKELGVISQIRLSFFYTMVVLVDFPTIEKVCTDHVHFDRAKQTTDIFRTIAPTGLISLPTNDMWKHHRRIIGPAMTSKYLSLTTPRANEAVRDIIDLWKRKVGLAGGLAWHAEFDLENATLDAICGMAFGTSWGTIRAFTQQVATPSLGSSGEAVFEVKRPGLAEGTCRILASSPQTSSFPAVSHFISRLSPEYRRHERNLRNFLDARLEASRTRAREMGPAAAGEVADNTLDLMVAKELKGEDWMPDCEMRDELFIYLAAGTGTSSTALAWWLKYMTNNPEMQRKLHKHLEHLPDPPTFEDVNPGKTPYLEAIVHETLRVARVAGAYTREAKQDVVILGQHVPKGTVVVCSTRTGYEDRSTPAFTAPSSSATSSADTANAAVRVNDSLEALRGDVPIRKVGYWAAGTATSFDPQRWLDAEGNFNLNAGPSVPFSQGQRGCFGKNLALLELRLFIAQLNREFFFASVATDQNSFDRYETITVHPKQCFARPVAWDSQEALM